MNVLFEVSRIKEIYLVEIYEKLIPPARKTINSTAVNRPIINAKFSYASQKEQSS